MKKALSLVMACLFLVAMMVPTFAADTTIANPDNPGENSAEIITKDTKEDGTDGRTWIVTYPAQTVFAWNTLVTDEGAKITYSAKAHLAYNEKLTVSVAASQDSKMVLADDANFALAYTLVEADDLVIGPVAEAEKTFKVDIPQAQWDAAPVGTYSDLLTFTAEVA